MKQLKRFICTLFGHRYDVAGVTGRYEWCSRCALRRDRGPQHDSMSAWRNEMNSMIRELRPDLAAEWENLYYGPPSKMGNFLDKHFPITPVCWGLLPIWDVPTFFRDQFIKTVDMHAEHT